MSTCCRAICPAPLPLDSKSSAYDHFRGLSYFSARSLSMPLSALGLLLLAAVLHALWNLFVKRAGEKQIFTWWALVVGVVGFSPLIFFGAALPARAWPYILGSAVMEAIYYIALTLAYKLGDFSLVYPLARGAAPALLAVWAALFLGE